MELDHMSHADAHAALLAALLARNEDTVEQFCIELRAKRRKVKYLGEQLQTERNDNEQLRNEVKRLTTKLQHANDQTKYIQGLMTKLKKETYEEQADADKEVQYLRKSIKEKHKEVFTHQKQILKQLKQNDVHFKQFTEERFLRVEAECKVRELQAQLHAANSAKSRKNTKVSHPYYMRFKEAQRGKAIARAEEHRIDDHLRRQAIAQEAEHQQIKDEYSRRLRVFIHYLKVYAGERVQEEGSPLQIYDDNVDVSDDAFKDTLNQAASLFFGYSAPIFSDGRRIMECAKTKMIRGVIHNPVTKMWRFNRADIAASPLFNE